MLKRSDHLKSQFNLFWYWRVSRILDRVLTQRKDIPLILIIMNITNIMRYYVSIVFWDHWWSMSSDWLSWTWWTSWDGIIMRKWLELNQYCILRYLLHHILMTRNKSHSHLPLSKVWRYFRTDLFHKIHMKSNEIVLF